MLGTILGVVHILTKKSEMLYTEAQGDLLYIFLFYLHNIAVIFFNKNEILLCI